MLIGATAARHWFGKTFDVILTRVHAIVDGGRIDQISVAQRTRDALVEIAHSPAHYRRPGLRNRKHVGLVLAAAAARDRCVSGSWNRCGQCGFERRAVERVCGRSAERPREETQLRFAMRRLVCKMCAF